MSKIKEMYIIFHLETQEMCDKAVDKDPNSFKYVPDQFKTQEMCNKTADKYPQLLRSIPDKFKTQEMCNKAVEEHPWCFRSVPDKFKTQEMCNKAVDEYPANFEYVPDHYITREICNKALDDDCLCYLYFIPDWFITPKMIENGDAQFHDPFKSYKQCKAQKSQIKAELLPIAWHPDRYMEWCLDEDEKHDFYFDR